MHWLYRSSDSPHTQIRLGIRRVREWSFSKEARKSRVICDFAKDDFSITWFQMWLWQHVRNSLLAEALHTRTRFIMHRQYREYECIGCRDRPTALKLRFVWGFVELVKVVCVISQRRFFDYMIPSAIFAICSARNSLIAEASQTRRGFGINRRYPECECIGCIDGLTVCKLKFVWQFVELVNAVSVWKLLSRERCSISHRRFFTYMILTVIRLAYILSKLYLNSLVE